MMRQIAIAVLLGASPAAHHIIRPAVPVMIAANENLDPCGNGVVRGLKVKGDGFLSVRASPSTKSREIDRLYNGEQVYICDTAKGGWTGIVYSRQGGNCNVMSPWVITSPYTGPCNSGWVSSRWVELYAG